AKVGPSVDRWALGLIAFRLLTGRNYWTADGMAALIGQIVYEPMVPPSQLAPHLGPRFDAWFAQACNREVERRFGNAIEQIKSLAEALGVSPYAPGSGPLDGSNPAASSISGRHSPAPSAPVFGPFPVPIAAAPVALSSTPSGATPLPGSSSAPGIQIS